MDFDVLCKKAADYEGDMGCRDCGMRYSRACVINNKKAETSILVRFPLIIKPLDT